MAVPSLPRMAVAVAGRLLVALGFGVLAGAWLLSEVNPGPVIFILTQNHGVHVGDVPVLVLLAAGSGLALLDAFRVAVKWIVADTLAQSERVGDPPPG